MHRGLHIDVGTAIEEQLGHRGGLPVMDRLGDAPAGRELGRCERGIGLELIPYIGQSILEYGVAEGAHRMRDEQLGDLEVRLAVAVAVVLRHAGTQQRVCSIAGMGEQPGRLGEDRRCGAHVTVAKRGKEGLLVVHDGG